MNVRPANCPMYSAPRTTLSLAAALLCPALLWGLCCGVFGAAPAHAGEIITYPGNGVLSDVVIGGTTYSDSLAPSASSPSGNSVTVNGGSIAGFVFGGYSLNGNAVSNSVVINGGSAGFVFGGYSLNGDVTGNSVVINGGSANSVSGGDSTNGNAVSNSVTVNGGSIAGTVYGGSSTDGNVTGNSVTVNGGSAGTVLGGYSTDGNAVSNSVVINGGSANVVDGGYSTNGNAVSNSVVINGGSIAGTVDGGYSTYGNAVSNSVVINGGSIAGTVYGGYSIDGNAVSNSVVINGGSAGFVYGGYSANGNSVSNSVTVNGGSAKAVYGGYSFKGNAVGNSVVINGGSIAGTVYGGYASQGTGSATHNTVSILGSPVFTPTAALYGGGTSTGTGDLRTGNTLNVFTSGITVRNISNFQHYNFALFGGGGTALTLTDAGGANLTDGLANSRFTVPYALSGTALNVGHKAMLLQSANLTNVPTAWNGQTGQTKQGVSLLYDYTLSTAADSISATVTGVQAAPESKALAESRAASMGFANLGADLVAGAGLANARAASAAGKGLSGGDSSDTWGLAPFFALSASNLRYNSGSHTDVQGVALMAGLAKKWELSAADVLAGAFFEAAFGDYKTHNSFGNGSPSVDGKGDTRAVGGGILARVDLTDTALKGLYAEASFRIGSLTSDYRSDDLRDFMGKTVDYDMTSTYYGAHAGLGYIWNFTDSASLDLYGKYFWTHQTGQDVTILGDPFSFKDTDSQRVKLGGRFSYAVTETLAPYVGAAWEYEFDGKARATTYGYDVPAPSLKGSTGVGEVGLNWKPEKAQGFSVDVAMQGYTGMREGISGNLLLKYEF